MVLLLPNSQMGLMVKNPRTVLDLTGAVAGFWDANTESSLTLNNQAGFQSVSQWDDISGDARHLAQPATANQLRLVRGMGNLFDYTQDLDNAYWTTLNLPVTANAASFPPYGTIAEKLTPSTTNGQHTILRDTTLVSGTNYTDSWYVWSAGYNFVQIATSTGFAAGSYQNFNLSTGTLGAGNFAVESVGIIPIGNGIWRVWASASATANGSGRMVLSVLNSDTASTIPSFAGDGTSGVFASAPMRNTGTTPNEYIGRNSLASDGVDDFMNTASFVIPQPFSRFSVVTRRNTAAIAQQILGSRLGVPNVALFHNTSISVSAFAGTSILSSQPFINGQTSQFGELYNGASSSFINNGNITTGNSGTNGIDGLNIGSFNTASAFSQNDIHAVLILNRLPTTTERQKLEVYLARRYGSWRSNAQGNPDRYNDVELVY